MGPTYWELIVAVSDDLTEGLTNFLWEQGALGVVEEQKGGEGPRLRAFFPGGAEAPRLHQRVGEYLDALRALGWEHPGTVTVAPLADTAWDAAWRTHFRPLPVGRRLLVAPPWDAPPDGLRLTIVIEPGRAFGTGHHGSTAGCLTRLEAIVERDRPGAAVDLGTGSGILAIAAARLGVGRILAVDEDPDATASAVANAARNGVAERVSCVTADATEVEVAPAPLVLANLLAAAHRRLAPSYARQVAPGGALVVGGILDEEATDVGAALRAHGFAERAKVSVEGWTTLELESLR